MISPLFFTIIVAYLTTGIIGDTFVFLGVVDIIGRCIDYYHAVVQYREEKSIPKLIKRFKHTHCQRQTLYLAIKIHYPEKSKELREQLYDRGYRYWKIWPDWIYTPGVLLSLRFWKRFTGLK